VPVLVDTHLHIHPRHDAGLALRSLAANLTRIAAEENAGDADLAAVLTEPGPPRLFHDLGGGGPSIEGVAIKRLGDGEALFVGTEMSEVLLVPGSQIVTAERLEVLSLGRSIDAADPLPIDALIDRIAEAGGLPVLPWSPGKWLFQRGRIVRELITRSDPSRFLLGDVTLRPRSWRESPISLTGQAKGFRVVAGSEGLPIRGEERIAGSYATLVDGAIDRSRPGESLRAILGDRAPSMRSVGRRSSLAASAGRLFRHATARR